MNNRFKKLLFKGKKINEADESSSVPVDIQNNQEIPSDNKEQVNKEQTPTEAKQEVPITTEQGDEILNNYIQFRMKDPKFITKLLIPLMKDSNSIQKLLMPIITNLIKTHKSYLPTIFAEKKLETKMRELIQYLPKQEEVPTQQQQPVNQEKPIDKTQNKLAANKSEFASGVKTPPVNTSTTSTLPRNASYK